MTTNIEIHHRILAHSSLVLYIAILIAILIYLKCYKKETPNLIFYTVVVWCAVTMKECAYFFGDIWYDDTISKILIILDTWVMPMTAYTFFASIQPKWRKNSVIVALFVPILIMSLLIIIFKGAYPLFIGLMIFTLCYTSVIAAMLLRLVRKHTRYIEENYSYNENIDARWIKYIIILLYVIFVIWFIISVQPSWLGDAVHYFSLSVFAIVFSVLSCNYKKTNNNIEIKDIFVSENESLVDKEIEAVFLSPKIENDIEAKLDRAMNIDKLYLDSELSLINLANYIGTNRTYLSKYINSKKSLSFINYVNEYRLEEAKRLLSDSSQKLNLLEVSERSGFNTPASFRRVFKQRFSCTRSQFLKLLDQEAWKN